MRLAREHSFAGGPVLPDCPKQDVRPLIKFGFSDSLGDGSLYSAQRRPQETKVTYCGRGRVGAGGREAPRGDDAASIIEPPHCSAHARCFDEEPHISRVGRSPQHEGGGEERYQRQC